MQELTTVVETESILRPKEDMPGISDTIGGMFVLLLLFLLMLGWVFSNND